MRDPLAWSLPLVRLFGILVRVHVLFPVAALGLVLRVAYQKDSLTGLWAEMAVVMVFLFVAVILHELGHCFAARRLGGDAQEVLIWPLGGLASLELPQTPRAHFYASAAGPFTSLVLALVVVAGLATASVRPSFKPWADPLFPVVHDWKENVTWGSKFGRGDLWRFTGYKDNGQWVTALGLDANGFDPKTQKQYEAVPLHPDQVFLAPPEEGTKEEQFKIWVDREKKASEYVHGQEMARPASVWITLAARFFWVNWLLFIINLLPAFPLDGGRMLQAFLWARSDQRQATLVAIFAGFLLMFVVLLYALVVTEQVMPMCLAAFIYLSCRRQWIHLETGGEESVFGYDFSQGYTSLEQDEAPPPPRRKQSWWQRWVQRRAARRLQREQELREAEERRMDELLDKIHRDGPNALNEEERRFLSRVSAKYRNRQ